MTCFTMMKCVGAGAIPPPIVQLFAGTLPYFIPETLLIGLESFLRKSFLSDHAFSPITVCVLCVH